MEDEKKYLEINFGIREDNTPEIYDFLFVYLERILKKMKKKKVKIRIDRLEPLNEIYTNLEYPKEKIEKILENYAKYHHLEKKENSLESIIEVDELTKVFEDYNYLFDIFFTEIIIESGEITIEMFDAFSNNVLIKGPEEKLKTFLELLKKMVKTEIKYRFS